MVSENTAQTSALIGEPMDPHPTQAQDASPRGPIRFAYATGSRPLDGYTIKRGIGRGGFGEVYFAVSDGGKEVAIKVVRHNLDIELRGVVQCLNLKHPNLIALYDVKQDEQDNTWVIMEYATGESLEDVIRRSPDGLPLEEALDWVQGIAASVAYLHDHGIVHRDLKTGNIFSDEGRVEIGDYGLSKFISCSRRSGHTESVGTVHYMAPEVANGRYGKEIDIYALGIILYEILTGHVPFEGESVGEVLMKHLTAEPTLTEIPAAYREVVARSLAKDPATRFASVAEMVAAMPPLAATMAQRPVPKATRAASEPEPAASGTQPPPPPGGRTAGYAGAAAGAAAPIAATLVDEEPIWRAIRDGCRSTRDTWDNFNTPTKIGLAVAGIILVSNGATWRFAVSILPPMLLLYVIYRIVRSVMINHDAKGRPGHEPAHANAGDYDRAAYRPGDSPPPQNAARPQPPQTEYRPQVSDVPMGDWRSASQRHWKKRRRSHHDRWHQQPAAAFVVKSPRERVTDLLGSTILAAIVGAAMSIVVILLRGEIIESGQFAWLALTSVAASWAVLVPSKIWEGREGEAILRRVALLMVGLAVGGAAYLSADTLMVNFPDSPMTHIVDARSIGSQFYNVKDGMPELPAYLAYFGSLFFIVGWWKQTDPLRRTRLSIWNTIWAVLVAWGITCVWPFPQPWGLMVAAIMSTSVQLVSPFVPHNQRLARQPSEES